jgi:membrane associated rhomboid family serine protease
MGESDRYQDYRSFKNPGRNILLGKGDNALFWLFAINVIVFLMLLMVEVGFFFIQSTEAAFHQQVLQWVELPANLVKLSERPWTLLTYMFSHSGVLHLLSNMLWLWAFGSILQDFTGNKKLIPIYIYGGLFGALFFIVANYSIPPLRSQVDGSALFGGNAATMAIAIATTMLAPGFRFFRMLHGGIPIWVLTGLYVLIDLAGVAGQGAAFSLAHIGGGLAGVFFVIMLRKGRDPGQWMNNFYSWLMNLFNPDKNKEAGSVKEKVFYHTGKRNPYQKTANITQQRIDDILDKISQEGYASLSDEEKKILKRASEEEL